MGKGFALSALLLLQAAPPQGPRVHWRLDEASGTVANDSSSGGANDGTHAGGTPSVDRPPITFTNPQSRSYDGVDDGTSLAQTGLTAGNTAHTLAAWIKITALPAVRAWIALLGNEGGGSHHWLVSTNGSAAFGVWNAGAPGQVQKNPVLTVGQWHHVAVTFDGTNMSCYVDGTELGTPVAATFNLQGVPLTLASAHIGENPFNGLLDDVRVYSRALTLPEVQRLAAGNGPPAAPLNLNAVAGVQSISLDWQASAGAASYTLRRTTTPGDPNPPVIASGLTGLTYADGGLTVGTRYYYVVTAVHSLGDESGFSNIASAIPLPIPPRLNDHEEGLLGESCSCGSSIASTSPWALAGLILLGVCSRRRRGSRPA